MQPITKTSSADLQGNSNHLFSYTVYALSPGAVKNPDGAIEINIKPTGNVRDESQKNFEMLLQSIGLRAMPIVINEPMATINLALVGAPSLAGEGFVFKFAVETEACFEDRNSNDPIGVLKDELHGIVLSNGAVIKTRGVGKNIEIKEDKHVENQ